MAPRKKRRRKYQPVTKYLIVSIVCLVVVLGFAGTKLLTQPHHQSAVSSLSQASSPSTPAKVATEQATNQSSVSTSAAVPISTPTPISTPKSVDDGDSVQECSVAVKPADYATFVTQILSYEQARLSPETQARKTLLDSLTSPAYQTVNPVAVDPNAQKDLKVVIDPKGSKVSCFAAPDGITRYVSVTPRIETETVNANGSTTKRNSYFKTPEDSTTWTLIGSSWLLASTNG